jgi:hypothetical protein
VVRFDVKRIDLVGQPHRPLAKRFIDGQFGEKFVLVSR